MQQGLKIATLKREGEATVLARAKTQAALMSAQTKEAPSDSGGVESWCALALVVPSHSRPCLARASRPPLDCLLSPPVPLPLHPLQVRLGHSFDYGSQGDGGHRCTDHVCHLCHG